MFIGGMGGAGIAFGTSMAVSLRILGRTRGGTSEFPLSPEVYDAFQRFKKGQAHYNYYMDEEKRVQGVLGKAEDSLKKASLYTGKEETLYAAPSSNYVRSLCARYKTLAGHLQDVQDLAVTYTMQPYRPEMPLSEKIGSALSALRGPGDQDRDSSVLIQKINQRLDEQKSKLEQLVDTANKMAVTEKQVVESIVRSFEVSGENYQALAEAAVIFPALEDSALVWKSNIEHVAEIMQLKQEGITAHDMVNSLWEPMKRIVAQTVASGKEQDIDFTLQTIQFNMRVHTEMVELDPEIIENRVVNEDMLTMLASLKQAQSEDRYSRVYEDTKQDVGRYWSKLVKDDYAQVFTERKKFIDSNSYADAFGLLNRVQEGLDSQRAFEACFGKKTLSAQAIPAYTMCFNEIQSMAAMGFGGAKPEAFDALLNTVGTRLSQQNAGPDFLPASKQGPQHI